MGRQVAWTIHVCSKVSDTVGSVLDLNEVLQVELKHGNVQSFNVRWDETTMTMKKQPDEEIQDNLFYGQLQQSKELKAIAVSSHSRHCSKKVNRETTTDLLFLMVVRYWEPNIREKHLFFRDTQLKKAPLALLQARASLRAEEK